MSMIARFLAALLLIPALALGAETPEDGWVIAAKARSPEDISLWTRYIPGAQLKAFRGATHTDMPLPNVVALLTDTETMPQWIFRCTEARVVGTAENGDTFFYVRINGIWPLEDRDAIIRAHPVYYPLTGELVIHGTAEPDYLPRAKDAVRIPSIESTWRMTPVQGNLVRIEWTGHVDPAGNVPRWLSNTVATLVPRFTMRSVRNLLNEPRWRSPAAREKGSAHLAQVRNVVR